MSINPTSIESCFDSLAGTPVKKRTGGVLAPSSLKRGTPSSSRSRNCGDRFIPKRSAMDLDVSHFELTRGDGTENNVNASPAKEDCARTPPAFFGGGVSAAGRQEGERRRAGPRAAERAS